MKPIVSKLMLFTLIALSTPLYAEGGASTRDKGLDGSTRYYDVVCPDGKRTSLTHDIQTKEVCAIMLSGDEQTVCKTNWDTDEAAKEACK